MSFITVSQCKQIVRNYLSASGRGGFLTGTVQSVAPLTVLLESGLPLYAADLYINGEKAAELTLRLQEGGAVQ